MGTIQQPFQYNGRDGVATDANGLYHMRARYYNPEIKRFINRDVLTGSISDSQTLNRYAYVNGNPISYVDPFGLSRDGDSAWLQGGSFLADLVPWVGTVKGFQQAFTGNNYITGEHLSAGDRWGEGIGATLSIIPIPGLKHAGKYGTKGVIWAGSKLFGSGKTNLAKNIDPWRSDFGLPSEGFGQLIRDLPKWDPMRIKFARMLKEVRASGGTIRKADMGGTYAVFGGHSIESGVWFRWNPQKLRTVDMLEEVNHWQQYKNGLQSAGYSPEALELMAKRAIINNYNLDIGLKKELLHDIQRVLNGEYIQ
ncbi:hypothetical protein ASF12_28585 [Paenibacillus sp. Leaf72]|nr:hypothetical protein ASF12_28585 [Paenibacillus sp. Leaf72]